MVVVSASLTQIRYKLALSVDGRSIQSIEGNLKFIAWLSMIYNSYWTHLAWSFDS